MNISTVAQSPPVVPAFHELMWPTLQALKAMGGSASNQELLVKIIELERIPEPVASLIHTDNRQQSLDTTKHGLRLI